MIIFESESQLIDELDKHDDLVFQCAEGRLDFSTFRDQYDNFYWRCALHGHESDDEESHLLAEHRDRIEPHRIIAETILGFVCADEDAETPLYVEAGRFGSKIAHQKLVAVVETQMKNA